MSSTLLTRLADALAKSSAGNSYAAAPAAAVLWPDKERQWESALGQLQQAMPQLLVLGAYAPEQRTGPAIWLKCAVAGALGELPAGSVPVVYLPGVSRADLRAIETCPRDLQPLAELQYRGVFWSQLNSKDWTVNAFLGSKQGGLGLDVTADKATQEALAQTVEAGVLLGQSVEALSGRTINAAWLNNLLAPNPSRDLLVWMNEPAAAQSMWHASRWSVFLKRCKSDFDLDVLGDGVLAAAEKLAKASGPWAAVWELFKDSYASFPQVAALLAKLQPPQLGLFDDTGVVAGYPQANEQKELTLRYALAACANQGEAQARASLLEVDKEHGFRRDWLWARMGQAPLALALKHLVEVAERSATLPSGPTLSSMAESYRAGGWRTDQAALMALAAVQAKPDVDAVAGALRAVYMPWLQAAAERLQRAVKEVGQLGTKPKAADGATKGLCTAFVDGLRYDVAVRLQERLSALGQTSLEARWTSLPSVTASGKAWCSPVADLVAGDKADQDFQPSVAATGKPLSAQNLRKLLKDNGVQPLDKHETGDPTGMAWVESGDLDHYGHEHGVRLARDIDSQLQQVAERIAELKAAGWTHFRIVTDHGWLLLPGGLPKTELPKHQTETRWGRCAVLKDTSHGTPLTFGWDWCADVQVAYAPGIGSFIAGSEYAHGGLSLQECLVPVLSLDIEAEAAGSVHVNIESVTWKGLRCIVDISPAMAGLRLDIRTKPAQASTSRVASAKSFEDGRASVAVKDDADFGLSASVVVLDADGQVLQKATTSVGG